MKCTLCRRLHNVHYADLRVMPTWEEKSPANSGVGSLSGRHNPALLADARLFSIERSVLMGEPSRVRVTGPLEPFAAGFIAELAEVGHRPAAAAVQVRVLAHLSRWMQEQHVSAERLREPELERFRREHLARVASVRGAGLTVVFGHLRSLGVVPAAESPVVTAADGLLEQYRRYLTVERGLAVGPRAAMSTSCVRSWSRA